MAYSFAGPWLPGFVGARRREPFLQLIDQQTLTTQGIFGIPTLVSATFIFLFVVFGSVMSHGGLLRFFTDGALAVAGRSRGGAGKVAVISSGLFGTVNGSAIANAVTTGAFTIPLMKRAGYRPEFAAGVEACASMGGQLIPPVMGAAAFIMAETLQVSYGSDRGGGGHPRRPLLRSGGRDGPLRGRPPGPAGARRAARCPAWARSCGATCTCWWGPPCSSTSWSRAARRCSPASGG